MDELQRLASDLQMLVLREVTGHDADTAAMWANKLVEETFAEKPRPPLLRVYLDEIEKKATRARALRDQIEAVRRAIV